MLETVGTTLTAEQKLGASLEQNADAVAGAAQLIDTLAERGVNILDRTVALTTVRQSLQRSRDAIKVAADLFDAKEFAAAAAVFDDIASAVPKGSSAQQKYAMALKYDRQFVRSFDVFSDLINNSSASAYTLWNAAAAALHAGRPDAAHQYLAAAQKLEPDTPRVRVYSALAVALNGWADDLLATLDSAIRPQFVELPQWTRNEVVALLEAPASMQSALAIALLRNAIGLPHVPLPEAVTASAETDASPATLLAIIELKVAEGDTAAVKRLLDLLLTHGDTLPTQRVKAHLLALKFGDARDIEANALALVDTSHAETVLAFIEEQIERGDGAKFAGVLEALARTLPGNPRVLRQLCELYADRGLHHLAMPYFERLLAKGDSDPGLHVSCAFSLWALNKFIDADHHFTRALDLAPGVIDVVRARAYLRFDKNDFVGALSDLTALEALTALEQGDLLRQAVAYRALAQHDAAKTIFAKLAAGAKPGTLEAWNATFAAICEAYVGGDKRMVSIRLGGLARTSEKFEEKLLAVIGLYGAGLFAVAEPVVDELVQRSTGSVVAKLWSLLIRLSWGGSQDAAQFASEVPSQADTIPELLYLSAIACAGADRHEQAERIAGQLGALHPSYPHLPLLLARLSAAKEAVGDDAGPGTRAAAFAALGLGGPGPIVPPRITVVVPNCNEARYISDCLNSVLMQSFPFWECIIVDDVSSDTSLEVAQSYVRADSRFQIVRHNSNKGLAATRNTGLKHAKGEYVTFLDADDYLSQHALYDRYRQLCLNRSNEAVAGTYCGMRHVAEHSYGEFELVPKALQTPMRTLQSSGYESPFNAHAPMLRVSVMRACGGFDESMRFGAEDWDCWVRLMRLGYHFVGTQKIGAAYRQKRHSMVRSLAPQHVDAAREIYAKLASPAQPMAFAGEPIYVYDKPLWYYQCVNVFAQRVLRFAAMAYMAGDRTGFDDILQRNAIPLDLLKAARVPIGDHVKSGVERFLAGVTNPLRDLKVTEMVSARVEEITALVTEKLRGVEAGGVNWLQQPPNSSGAPAVIRPTAGAAPPADYEKLEERFAFKADTLKLRGLYNKHKGERCFIVGNGPSLNLMDLTKLKNDISIGVNGIFYKTDEMGYAPNYYVVEDSSVMKENIARIIGVKAEAKFFPTIYHDLHPADDNVHFFTMNRGFYEPTSPNYCVPRFSTDFSQRAFCGQSVTYINLQLAFYMGFTKVYLIGMDFSYVIPPEHEKKGDIIKSTTDDPNHFNPNYFGKGKTWKDPKLDRVLQNYQMAKFAYECAGRSIINATVGGKLDLFDRAPFESLF